MPDKKISQLTSGGASQAGDEYPIARSGANFKVTGANIAAAATSVGTLTSLTVSGTIASGQITASANVRSIYSASGANVSVVANNTSATAAGTSQLIATNDASRSLRIQYAASGGFSTSAITGGVSTEGGQIFTDGAYPLLLGTNSAARMTISSTGNVGIGTASPASALDVQGGNVTVGSTTTGRNISIFSSSAGNNGLLRFYDTGNAERLQLAVTTSSVSYFAPTGTSHIWSVNTERMRLDASGNLGLGVTPSAWDSIFRAEQIGTGIGTTFIAGRTDASNSGFFGVNTFYNGTDWVRIGASNATRYWQGAGAHYWETSASSTAGSTVSWTQAMTLDASGNLLVNRTSAFRGGRLVVAGTNFTQTSNNGNVQFLTTDTQAANVGASLGLGGQVGGDEVAFGYISGRKENGTAGNYAGYLAFATINGGASCAERVRIDSVGRLMVGTTSGTEQVSVVSSDTFQLSIKNSSASSLSAFGHDSTNNLRINVNGAERARIDASGNFYIGTTSQSGGSNITFAQPANADMKIAASVSTGTRAAYQVFINTTVSTVGTENSSGGSLASGTSAYATVLANSGAYPICFATNNNERARITSGGDFCVNATSGNGRLSVRGAGTTSATNSFEAANSSGNTRFLVSDDGLTRFYGSSGGETARITSGGNVGIGTQSPSYQLHSQNPNSGDQNLFMFTVAGGFTNGVFADWIASTFNIRFRIANLPTTASAANAFLDSGDQNRLYRSTSSIRYKTDIESIETQYSDAVLNLRPVWYRSIAGEDKRDWSWYGLIAEEVAEIEPRLVHWTYLEEDYDSTVDESGVVHKTPKPDAKMVPDGVQYDRVPVLLLDVVKRQAAKIEEMEARLAALEA